MKTTSRAFLKGALLVVTLMTASLSAQAQEMKYKVGDRVEVHTFMASTYPGSEKYAKWRKGTIVRLDNPENRFGAYIVTLDADGSEFRVRFVDTQFIRAKKATDAKAIDEKARRPNRNQSNQSSSNSIDVQKQLSSAWRNLTTKYALRSEGQKTAESDRLFGSRAGRYQAACSLAHELRPTVPARLNNER